MNSISSLSLKGFCYPFRTGLVLFVFTIVFFYDGILDYRGGMEILSTEYLYYEFILLVFICYLCCDTGFEGGIGFWTCLYDGY